MLVLDATPACSAIFSYLAPGRSVVVFELKRKQMLVLSDVELEL